MKNLMLILIFATAGSFQTAKGLFIQPDSKIASKDQDSDGTTKIIDNNMVGTKIVDKENVDSKTSNGRGGIIGTEIFDKDIIAAAMEIKEKTFEDRAEIVDKVIFDTENVNSKNVDEEKEEESETYTCFPWLFNPGCFLNGFVDWKWACKTNTLGWEQCDVMKRKEMKEKAKILEKHFKPSDSGSIKEQH